MSDSHFDRVVKLGTMLPETSESTWYGTPSLKVKGKGFVRMKEKMDGVLVVTVPIGLKEALIEAEPEKYFETPHYAGWPAMLVRLDAISDDELQRRLECAWLEKAPRKLATGYNNMIEGEK
ncbi:MAG: hypothetical protein HKN78_08340 [Sphingomonadaceae bacterium]|nr:hypothetical protein [Sphingomonadaceae bacterium]